MLGFRFGDALGSFFGSFVDVARVAALGITGTRNKNDPFCRILFAFVFAAFRAGFVKFLRGNLARSMPSFLPLA